MDQSKKIALVTGGNKGLGFATVKGLCQTLSNHSVVYIGARCRESGYEAVKRLRKEKLDPEFLFIDLYDRSTIEDARDKIMEEHGGLDILVNNAAVSFKPYESIPFGVQAERSVVTNFHGTLDVCDMLFPILRPHARVVNLSSLKGNVKLIPNESVRQRLTSDSLTLGELNYIIANLVRTAKSSPEDAGYPNLTGYGISKIGVTAMTGIQQRLFQKDQSRPDIVVNAVNPGFVATEMTNFKGHKTVEQGAEPVLYAALLPQDNGNGNLDIPRGQFISEDCEVRNWKEGF